MTQGSLNVTHDEAARRFVSVVDGHTSYLAYTVLDDHTLDYRSTYVPNELRGRGIASELVKHALAYARDRRLKVVPTCPFVARIMERDPAYRDLDAG